MSVSVVTKIDEPVAGSSLSTALEQEVLRCQLLLRRSY